MGKAHFFFSQSNSTFSWPTCWYKAAFSASSSLSLLPSRLAKSFGTSSQDHFLPLGDFHGMDPILACQLIDRPLPADCF
jgi:hypothetical protein